MLPHRVCITNPTKQSLFREPDLMSLIKYPDRRGLNDKKEKKSVVFNELFEMLYINILHRMSV